jgi:hypothetical protein
MGKHFNYKWHRSRCKLKAVEALPDNGLWVTVAEGSRLLMVSKQTIRNWYVKGKISAVKYNGLIYVDIHDENLWIL